MDDKFIKTVIGDISTINLDQPRQVEQWTQILGVTEEELRRSVAQVGVSARAVWKDLRRRSPDVREPGYGTPSKYFAEDGNAVHATSLLAKLRDSRSDRNEILDEFMRLVPRLVEAIHDKRLQLDYVPPASDAVDIPQFDHPHYLQALLYWSIRLDTTLPRLTEAHIRLDGAPTIAQMHAMFRTLDEEQARGAGAGTHPILPVTSGGAMQDGIYKVIFTTDARSLGDGVCLARDDQVVGANFGYSVAGTAALEHGVLVLSMHFTRQRDYQSPLNLPPAFELQLRGSGREDGFNLAAILPSTDVRVQVSGRRVSD